MEEEVKTKEAILKPCPNCRKLNHVETRICICGFWLKKHKAAHQTLNFQPARRKPKITLKNPLIFAALIAVVGVLAAFWGGYADFTQNSKSDVENASLEETAPLAPAALHNPSNPPLNKPAKGTIEGKVVAVNSGDMITVLDKNNQEYEIRLGDIDAPGLKQDFGQQSKENLSTLIFEKSVQVFLQQKDDDGLLIGKVLLDGTNINLEQIKAGFAYHNKYTADNQSEDDRQLYANAENAAKTAKFGFWSDDNPAKDAKIYDAKNDITLIDKPKSSLKINRETSEAKGETQSDTTSTQLVPTTNSSTSKVDPPTKTNSENEMTTKSVAATARCVDGTLSYSATRRGACSRHGGVAAWFDGSNAPTKLNSKTDLSERKYIVGPRGGCYYITGSGRKTYVNRELCEN